MGSFAGQSMPTLLPRGKSFSNPYRFQARYRDQEISLENQKRFLLTSRFQKLSRFIAGIMTVFGFGRLRKRSRASAS